MKNITRYSVRLLLAVSVLSSQLRAEVTVTDGTNSSFAAGYGVNTLAYNKNTGRVYVGLIEGGAPSNFRISWVGRPTTSAAAAAPTFTAVASATAITAPAANLNTLRIDQLSIIPTAPGANGAETLVFLAGADAAGIAAATRPVATTSTGTLVSQAAAADIQDGNAAANGRVIALRGMGSRLLAIVKANGAATADWGTTQDDAATLVTVTNTGGAHTFVTTATAPAAGTTLTTQAIANFARTANLGVANGLFLDAHYDDILGKLYVSKDVTAGNVNAADLAFGFVMFDVTNAAITLTNQTGVDLATSITAATQGGAKIVVAQRNNRVQLRRIRTLHTSAGYPYLIVQGGTDSAAADTQFNRIRAVPLVRANSPYAGRLAVNDLDCADTPVATGATANDALPLSADANSTVVGGGVLPADAAANITDMQVVGSTVYVAIDVAANGTNAPGLYYSQAILNDIGKVANWTDWAKVVKDETSGTARTVARCYRFAVDAAGGRIWTVPGGAAEVNRTLVKMTTWANSGATSTLQGQINGILNGTPCYSYFDLNNTVRNFANGTGIVSRIAFFGGMNKVCVAQLATGTAAAFGSAPSFEVQTDLTNAANSAVDISTGLENAGPIVALGWTGLATGGNTNFFLAGSPRGLYAFRKNTALGGRTGFNIISINGGGELLGATNAVPFTGTFAAWELTGLTEPVLNIVTDNATAYIHTRTINASGVSIDRVYRLIAPATGTVAALTDAANLVKIAETGAGSAGTLTNVRCINGIALVAQNAGGTQNELALATDQGVYMSRGGNIIASTEGDAAFTRVSAPVEVRNLSSNHHSRIPATIWGTEQATSRYNQPGTVVGSYSTQEDLLHLGTNAAATITTGINFDGFNTNTANVFGDLSLVAKAPGGMPTSHGFFSDGAFRVMLSDDFDGNSPHDVIRFLPWDVSSNLQGYNISSLITIPDAALQTTATNPLSEIYWVHRIAGHLCVGYDKGLAVLS